MCFNSKVVPTNDTDYSCHIKVVKLCLGNHMRSISHHITLLTINRPGHIRPCPHPDARTHARTRTHTYTQRTHKHTHKHTYTHVPTSQTKQFWETRYVPTFGWHAPGLTKVFKCIAIFKIITYNTDVHSQMLTTAFSYVPPWIYNCYSTSKYSSIQVTNWSLKISKP